MEAEASHFVGVDVSRDNALIESCPDGISVRTAGRACWPAIQRKKG